MGNEEFNAEFEGGSTNEELFNVEFDEVTNIGGGAVNSVNGQTGDVVLTTSDLENDSDYQTGSEVESAISTAVATETTNREAADTALQTAITNEATTRANADTNLQSQIDAISASSDVTDIVGTYAELQSYDTSTLGDNDIIKVLQDESQNGETTYYRWSTSTQSFTLIGEEGPYYTKSQTDTLLNAKQNSLTAGDGINISNDEISGVDFVGTDGTAAGEAGLVPAPATTDAGKFLKADGTWDDAGGGGGGAVTLTTDDYNWNSSTRSATEPFDSVALWLLEPNVYRVPDDTFLCYLDTDTRSYKGVFIVGETGSFGTTIISTNNSYPASAGRTYSKFYVISRGGIRNGIYDVIAPLNAAGNNSSAPITQNGATSMVFKDPNTRNIIQIGTGAIASQYAQQSVAIGSQANSTYNHGVALGSYARTTRVGEVNIGSSISFGYNNTAYRVLGGVHDPVDDHDAATKGYVDTVVAGAGGGGGVKILTADDYNWNSTTNTAVEPFDSVALWLLDSGIYMRTDSSVVAYRNIGGGTMLVDEVYILGSNANLRPIVYYAYADTGSGRERVGYVEFVYSSASTLSGQSYKSIPITAPVNNLTSTATAFPLSANQGKVLNDKITALEARVAALEGN